MILNGLFHRILGLPGCLFLDTATYVLVPKGLGPQVILKDCGFVPNVAKDAEGLPEEIKLAFCEWNLG